VVSAVAPNRYLQGLTLQSLQVGDVTTWAQSYKTFYVSNLLTFVIS
jgi:hypothetical protein